MRRYFLAFVAASALAVPLAAQTPTVAPYPAPSEIVAAAPASDWTAIDAADLLVMTLAADGRGPSTGSGERRVIIQLMPAPFSQGWVGNIRTLAAAHWWDGLSVNRVQDNYVVQWGDADGEDAAKARALPEGLRVVPESEYTQPWSASMFGQIWAVAGRQPARRELLPTTQLPADWTGFDDPYANAFSFVHGMPIAMTTVWTDETEQRVNSFSQRSVTYRTSYISPDKIWPVHCYAMVGVGRNLSPETGSGAELYTVIGHAPRHLDRNIALVGRVIEGIEHLSSLPRGTGALGFYESAEERVPIVSIRLATALPAVDQPRFETLSTESDSFARYAEARANRRDPFFNMPAGGADICNIPVPVRRVAER